MNSLLLTIMFIVALWIVGYGIFIIVKNRVFLIPAQSGQYAAVMEFVNATKAANETITNYTNASRAGNPPGDKRGIAQSIATMMAMYANEICQEKTMLHEMPEVDARNESVMDLLRVIGMEEKGSMEAGERWATDLIDLAIMELEFSGKLIAPEKIQNPAVHYFSTS